MCFSSGPASGWGRPCLWSACVRSVAQHRPQVCLPPALLPEVLHLLLPPGQACGALGNRPGPWSWLQGWPLPRKSSSLLRPFPALGWSGGGNVGVGGRLLGLQGPPCGILITSHHEGRPGRPLGHGGCLHTSCCLLTQGRLLQGRRCRLGNQGVQGPPKQPGSRSPQKPQKALRG